MSHRPPQHPVNLNTFGFNALGGAAIDPMQANQPPGTQATEDAMMSLLDNSMFASFDPGSLSMSLDADSVAMPPPSHLDGFQQRALVQQQAPPASAPGSSPGAAAAIGTAGAAPHAAGVSAILSAASTPAAAAATHVDDAQNKFQPPPGGNSNAFGIGGGPPLSSAPLTLGSTLTEFTKKRDWAAKTVGELADMQQILDENGRVKYVSPSVTALTGYSREEMMGLFLKELIHPDDIGVYTAELNEAISTGGTMRVFYRLRKRDGSFGIFETVGHGHIAAAKFAANPHNQSQFCQAVFLMSRPYPTENAALLDSFLEHKMENERLRRRIAELRREEDEEDEAQRQWHASQSNDGPRSEVAASEDTPMSATAAGIHENNSSSNRAMPPPDRRIAAVNTALTRENLEGSIAGNAQDSISDKMARYEGLTSHAETIEMLTGLRYQEGERSRGLGPGGTSPMLVKGDVGIAMPLDRDRESRGSGDKKKKQKVADEYVCTDCGTLDSPEWRKGPSGPKTLCNACGLRWAKREKKRNAKSAKTTGNGNGGGGNGNGSGAVVGPGGGTSGF